MPLYSNSTQRRFWLFESPEKLAEYRLAHLTASHTYSSEVVYHTTISQGISQNPIFILFLISNQIVNPYQSVCLALDNYHGRREARKRFHLSRRTNEILSVAMIARQFIEAAVSKHNAGQNRIQGRYDRARSWFHEYTIDCIKESFYNAHTWAADVLARRITCFLNPTIVHPLSAAFLSLLISFKISPTDVLQRPKAYYGDFLYQSHGLIDPQETAETNAFLLELKNCCRSHEPYILQNLRFSVYCTLAEDFISEELLAQLQTKLKVPHFDAIHLDAIRREVAFFSAITRVTDAYLLYDPDAIAVFLLIEAGLMYLHEGKKDHTDTKALSRRALYDSLGRLAKSMNGIRVTLFYFIDGSVPNTPDSLRRQAQAAADVVMPLESIIFLAEKYEEFCKEVFDFSVLSEVRRARPI
ncbi:hypothetical protein GMRT_15257 [Giardia muris]|uniref:Uncharacterized protein n=1 Tax=Giardia muris TaxID=5742 RepID=A0A4Z1T6R9_GIAMU|nr:hypothetical protein GMRT_15257 [Giardia muris]|eukprot:TNJ28181.1 hypothetical protein GMRT_15257 [Giardia muris]